jgi:hypothetical protein
VLSRSAGETVWRMRRIESGSTFRGRLKPKMEASRRKAVRVQVMTRSDGGNASRVVQSETAGESWKETMKGR